jgi:hypothetical protein
MQTITDHSSSKVARSFRACPPERSLSGRSPSEKLLLNHSISNKRKLLTTSDFWVGGKRPKTRLKTHTQFFLNPFSFCPSLSLASSPPFRSLLLPLPLRCCCARTQQQTAQSSKTEGIPSFPFQRSFNQQAPTRLAVRVNVIGTAIFFFSVPTVWTRTTLLSLSLSLSHKTSLFPDRNISSGVEFHAPGKWLTIADWLVESVCSFQPTKACHLCESNWNGHLFSFSDSVNEKNTDTLRLDCSRTEPSVPELNLLWLTILDWFVEFNRPFQLHLAHHAVWKQLERRSFIFQTVWTRSNTHTHTLSLSLSLAKTFSE